MIEAKKPDLKRLREMWDEIRNGTLAYDGNINDLVCEMAEDWQGKTDVEIDPIVEAAVNALPWFLEMVEKMERDPIKRCKECGAFPEGERL